MDIQIDGERFDLLDEVPPTAGDVFDRVDEWIARKGRCVVGITIDGNQISSVQLGEITLRRADSFDRFEFVTQSTSDLVESLVGELESKIEELGGLARELAMHFQGEVETPPLDMLAKMVEVWRSILERIVTAAGLLRIEMGTLDVPGTGLAGDHHDRVTDTLNKIVSAVEQSDFVLVADLLEYEVAPGVEREAAVLAALRRAATSPNTD